MVRGMPLKEMDMIIDGIDQADMLGELEHGRDSCIIDGLSSLSKFVLHVIGSENGIGIRETSNEPMGSCDCESF